MEQFNSLIEFRQAVYDRGLTKAKDAQFELVDALLVGAPIRSFPELSLLPGWHRLASPGGKDVGRPPIRLQSHFSGRRWLHSGWSSLLCARLGAGVWP
jgi:hypothetical protein